MNYDDYTANQRSLAENAVIKFFDWESANKVKYIASELQMVSEKYQYGGTCDILAELDGKLTLVDLKTCKGIYTEMITQLAGYEMALQENGHKIVARGILRIGRDEEEGFEWKPVLNMDLHRKRFVCCRNLYELNALIRKAK